jgi:hypothetical protein
MAELADAADLKSAGLKRLVGVRVPLSAPILELSVGIRPFDRQAMCLASLLLLGQSCDGILVRFGW